ncbi:MAG: hypothetical protein AABW99_02435 [archaeon]
MSFLTKNLFELIFYSILGVFLVSLFFISFIQGITLQLVERNVGQAFIYYLTSVFASLVGFVVYLRGKRVIELISEHDFIRNLFKG